MFKMISTIDYSYLPEDLIAFDTSENKLVLNKDGYEELTLELSLQQLQELFNQMHSAGMRTTSSDLEDYEEWLISMPEEIKQKIFKELYDEGYGDHVKEKQWELEEKLEKAEEEIAQLQAIVYE